MEVIGTEANNTGNMWVNRTEIINRRNTDLSGTKANNRRNTGGDYNRGRQQE